MHLAKKQRHRDEAGQKDRRENDGDDAGIGSRMLSARAGKASWKGV
jgi:hypothetical protein